ncbi:MAG: hypothetical protein LBF24_00980 [Puniceicoccales bacterium]|jgi:hypothetical protein|nr:hypothetical protein [Puniceicoccales bacterium]
MRKPYPFLLLLLCAGCCVHYQLGTRSRLPISTISVAPVKSCVDGPNLRGVLWQQIRQEIQQIPNLRLVDGDDANGELTVRIVSVERGSSLIGSNGGGGQRITIKALCTVLDRRTGTVLIADRLVRAFVDVPWGQTAYDGQALPALAAALAREIRSLVANSW